MKKITLISLLIFLSISVFAQSTVNKKVVNKQITPSVIKEFPKDSVKVIPTTNKSTPMTTSCQKKCVSGTKCITHDKKIVVTKKK